MKICFRNGTIAFKEPNFEATFGANLDLGAIKFYLHYNHGLTSINNYDNRDSWNTREINFGIEVPIYKH